MAPADSAHSIATRFDASFRLELSHLFTSFVTIVGTVCQDMSDFAGGEIGQEVTTMRTITILSRTQADSHKMTVRIDARMNLRIQPTPAATNAPTTVGILFFSSASRRPPLAT